MAPPAALTCSSSDVLCAPDFLLSATPVVTALSACASTAPATPNASACPVAMPPVDGNVAIGDCEVTPGAFTYVPNAFPVTVCACTAPARRVSATRNFVVMVVLLESSVVAGQAMLLDVATRQNAVPRVDGTDRDLDVVIPDARLRDVARVIDFERHVFERPVVARVEPAEAAETPAASIGRGLVRRRREERHSAVEREAAAELGGVVLVPLQVAAAVGRRALAAGPGLEAERREVVRLRRVLRVAEVVALIDSAAAREAKVGAWAAALGWWSDPRRDVARRARGVLTPDGKQDRRDCAKRQRQMSCLVHWFVPFLSLCMLRERYMFPAHVKCKAGASIRVLDTGGLLMLRLRLARHCATREPQSAKNQLCCVFVMIAASSAGESASDNPGPDAFCTSAGIVIAASAMLLL